MTSSESSSSRFSRQIVAGSAPSFDSSSVPRLRGALRRCCFAYGRYGRTWAALAAAGRASGARTRLAAAGAVYDFIGKPEALLGAAFVAAVGVVTAVRWHTQMTAVLGLVGAMLGPTLIEGGVSVAGSAS